MYLITSDWNESDYPDVWLKEKGLSEKGATFKRFEYLPLGKESKAQTDIVKKKYQGINKFFKSDEKEEPMTIKKKQTKKSIINQIYHITVNIVLQILLW